MFTRKNTTKETTEKIESLNKKVDLLEGKISDLNVHFDFLFSGLQTQIKVLLDAYPALQRMREKQNILDTDVERIKNRFAEIKKALAKDDDPQFTSDEIEKMTAQEYKLKVLIPMGIKSEVTTRI